MGSVLTSGYASERALQIKSSRCEKSDDGQHDWERMGSPPSSYGKCRKCGVMYFDK